MVFVDLENSSAIAERLEPEDLLELIRRYREFCGAAIMRYGGLIARLLGDGILAYFCYPVAHENDPERSVRAALDIVRGVGAIATPTGDALAVRIGMATGRVIVSDLFAGGEDRRSIIGSTPNLAARMQNLAPANGIVIAEETHDRVASQFTFEDLGVHALPGFIAPRHIWRVTGDAPPQTQIHPGRRGGRMTPFHGRQAELSALAHGWQRARQGDGNTIFISGEAGIGKSRLIGHFVSTQMDDTTRVVRLAASALDQDSPLYPVIAFVRAASGLLPDDEPAIQRGKLEAVLVGGAAGRAAALPLLVELLGMAPRDATTQVLPPAVLRERILQVVVDQILLPADNNPLCIVFEDLHWLDPTSSELLERIVESMVGRPVLLLLTARDGIDPVRTGHGAVTTLQLAPLDTGHVVAMLGSLLVDRAVPPDLVEIIAERTDGVPLFVEEVARSLLQSSEVMGVDDFAPLLTIPTSLDETLMARLDRSGTSKQIAQIAAVLGRSVRHDVLRELAASESIDLDRPLADLLESGVLVHERASSDETYSFSHALLRDAAYESLLRADRQRLHLGVARVLQAIDAPTIADRPELLALHLSEGDEVEEAGPHLLEAARRSLARSALTEATRLLRRGLSALEKLPAAPGVLDLRVEFNTLLGPALIALKGPASSEAQELYADAFSLCESLPENPAHFPIYWGWWRVIREFPTKQRRASALLERAIARADPELLLQAHHCNWATWYDVGEFTCCCEHIEAGLQIYDQGDFRHHGRLYGNHDPKVCGLGARAQVHWMQGRPANGVREERQSVEWAQTLDHLGSRVHVMDTRLLHRAERHEPTLVLRLADEFVNFTTQHGMSDHRAKGLIFRGWAVAMQDDPMQGVRILEEGLARQREIGTLEDFPIYICLLAEALARAGKPERAVEELQGARAEFACIGLRFWMPEVLRLLADVILRADPSAIAAAQTLLVEASALAEAQGVPMLGLRIAVSAARLDIRLNEIEHAARRLDMALARIAEDDSCPDLLAAKDLAGRIYSQLGQESPATYPSPP
jgi:class 3 adenylate cyclase/predicted ATPase